MGTFSFKPGLLRGSETWTVENGILAGPGNREANISDVTFCRFVDIYASGNMNAALTVHADDSKVTIVCNDRANGAQRPQFLGLVEEILTQIAQAKPGFEVTDGYPGFARFLIAVGGIFLVIVGAAIGLSASTAPHGLPFLLLGAGMALGGIWIALMGAPWKKSSTKPVSEILELIAATRQKRG